MEKFFILMCILLGESLIAENLKSFYIGMDVGYSKINPKDVNDDNESGAKDLAITNVTRTSWEEFSRAYSSSIEFGYLHPIKDNLILDSSLSFNYIESNTIKLSLDYVPASGHIGNIFNTEDTISSEYIMLREALIYKSEKYPKLYHIIGLGLGYSFKTSFREKATFNKDNYLAFVGQNPPADYEGEYKGTNPVYEIFAGNKYQFTNSFAASFKIGYRILKCTKLNATKAFGFTNDGEPYKDRNDNIMEFDLSGVFINFGARVYF